MVSLSLMTQQLRPSVLVRQVCNQDLRKGVVRHELSPGFEMFHCLQMFRATRMCRNLRKKLNVVKVDHTYAIQLLKITNIFSLLLGQ